MKRMLWSGWESPSKKHGYGPVRPMKSWRPGLVYPGWTVSQMEKGAPGVSLGAWIKVSNILGLLESWNGVMELPPDPFAEYDAARKTRQDLLKARVRKRKNR